MTLLPSAQDRETKLARLEACKQMGEKAYDAMYEASSFSAATGYYSEAKESFYEAIKLARELELESEVVALEQRLAHIQAVFRSQFVQ